MSKNTTIKKHKAAPEKINSQADIHENRKRFTIDIPVSLHTKLKIMAVKRGETMAEIIQTMIEEIVKDE